MYCNSYVVDQLVSVTLFSTKTKFHVGRFLFRHKGKKKKGKPNYPPHKAIVRDRRRCAKASRGQRRQYQSLRRENERVRRQSIKMYNRAKRVERLIDQSANVIRLFEPKGLQMFARLLT